MKIEKIEIAESIRSQASDMTPNMGSIIKLTDKINELVNAVNELAERIER